jgi:hypothetical protein
MNAEEARAIRDKALSEESVEVKACLQVAHEAIRAAARRGESSLHTSHIFRSGTLPVHREAVLNRLRQDGYKIEHGDGDRHDQRGRASSTILW